MAKYDDASWHYGGDFPADLPPENGATHIGLFLTWCIDNNLSSEMMLEDFAEDIEKVKKREMTGVEFLLQNCDEKFTDEDLNDQGNEFTNDYYNEDTEFTKLYPPYLQDYEIVAKMWSKEFGKELKSFYHFENSWEFYDEFKFLLDERFTQWKLYKALK